MIAEQTMLKLTFAAAILVMVLAAATMVVNVMAYFDRSLVFGAVVELQKRVAALEEWKGQKPQLPQEKGQPK